MTETYTAPTDNGKKTRTPAPTRVQVEIVRQFDGHQFVGINTKNTRVLVTVGDPDRVIKMLALAVGTSDDTLGVHIYVPAGAVEAF